MVKHSLLILSFMCLFNIVAHAQPAAKKSPPGEPAGIGIGALIGGLLAGPPGAIVGAAGGAWIASRSSARREHIADLKQRLSKQQSEFVALQQRFAREQSRKGEDLQRVALQRRKSVTDQLAHGVSLTVYFRTDSAALDPDVAPDIKRLARFLAGFPEIQLRLDAYADRRGSSTYNLNLSRQRGKAVTKALMAAGVPGSRIHEQPHGENGARAASGDTDGYAFDRRVTIHLSLNAEA